MPSSKGFLLAIVLLAGCAPPRQPVFVDVGVVVASEAVPPVYTSAEVVQPPRLERTTLVLEPLPERTLHLEGNQQRIRHVEALIEQSQRQMTRLISNRLRDAYLKEIAAFEAQRIAELAPEAREAMIAAMARIREVFDPYADQRGPMIAELSMLVGFPDPDPLSQLEPSVESLRTTRAKERYERAKRLRVEIRELDNQYDARVAALLSEVQAEQDLRVTDLRVEIEQRRAAAEQRAMREAAEVVQREQERIESVLAQDTEIRMPAVQGRSVTVEGSREVVARPQVEFPGAKEAEARLRMAVENDAHIWAAQQGYRLVESKGLADDKTSEFMEWRRKNLAGR